MAEGGPRPDTPSVDGARSSHLLDCPICLEQLRLPKYLPCLHTFCEECLSLYIVKETISGKSDNGTSFTCPVCRKLTHPVDTSEDKKNWVQQFPIDSNAVERIRLANQTTEHYQCKPCHKKGRMATAQFWCEYNKSFFCKSCKEEHHDMVHTDCDILNIMVSDKFQFSPEVSIRKCDKHKERMDCYCQDHRFLGCSKCIHVDHRKCEDVSTTEEYFNTLDKSSHFEEKRKSLKELVCTMDSLMKEFSLQIQNTTDSKDAVLKSLDDLQERIIKWVTKMKSEVMDELITKFKEEHEKLRVSSQKCERLKAAMENTLALSATAQQNKDHVSAVLLYQRAQAEIESCKDLLEEISNKFSTTTLEHEFHFDVSGQVASLSLGKVAVRKQPRSIPVGLKALHRPFSKRELKQIRQVYIRCPSDSSDCSINGLVYLSDGRIVISDYANKKLKLINIEGDVVDEMKVNGYPFDMCMVDNTTVAVGISRPGGIRVVKVTSSKITLSSEINTKVDCYGIVYRDGEFVVSTRSDVVSVTNDGTIHKLLGQTGYIYGMCRDPIGKQLFLTHYTDCKDSTAVSRLTADDVHTDLLKAGVVKKAYGVDMDVERNVYVCGDTSNNVMQMSWDGSIIRELLTEADGTVRPRGIFVCGDKVVVSNVSAEKRNYIHLFQLV
ncbi:transcription intermediary factor 1-alpha-like [Argopecten irradians]|uniref:transcription intermediary factor 1-alpha-like n=1 Tax=Argopecten irradians TaxID=31199 RepID=UPI00371CBF76